MKSSPGSPQCVLVAVSGSPNSEALVLAGKRIAAAVGASWEAVHIETPRNVAGPDGIARIADALGLAAKNGAAIATIAAATVIDGIDAHLESSPATHIVLGAPKASRWQKLSQNSVLDRLANRTDGLVLHIYPGNADSAQFEQRAQPTAAQHEAAGPSSYAYAVGLVVATLLVAAMLQLVTGPRPLDLLFLFPVIAVAARLGLGPALLAAGLSVIFYNYFLRVPAFSFDADAPQNLVMAAVLIAVAAYTSMMTNRMRGRVRLSDRSAKENAILATLAQRLTRESDWESTAATICEHVHSLLKVDAIVFREVEGRLVAAASVPPNAQIGPVDQAALEWTWSAGEEAGAGTARLSAADWQFQPLKTSLGTLAVLGLARHDGRDPVRPDQQILLSTLIAQAALAHERLRLEAVMRENPAAARSLEAN